MEVVRRTHRGGSGCCSKACLPAVASSSLLIPSASPVMLLLRRLLSVPWFCQVYALGFVSVFDQILDGFDAGEKDKIFTAYVRALGEDPAQYRVRPGTRGWGGDAHNQAAANSGASGAHQEVVKRAVEGRAPAPHQAHPNTPTV